MTRFPISAAQAEGGWNEGGKSPVQIDYAGPDAGIGLRPVYYRAADGSRGVMQQFDKLPEGASYELFDDIEHRLARRDYHELGLPCRLGKILGEVIKIRLAQDFFRA